MPRLKTAAVFLVLLAGAARAGDSIYWLDKEGAEAAYNRLTSVPDGKRSAADWTQLGWAELLYRNDADRALDSFQKAAQADPKHGDAWEGVHSAAFARLRSDLMADAIANLALGEPDSARVEALFRVGRVQQNAFVAWPIPRRVEFALKLVGATKNPRTLLAARDWLRDLYETQVRTDLAFAEWKAAGRIERWHAIGAFGPNGAACWDDELPPEREFKPEAQYPVGRAHARWHEVRFAAGNTGAWAATRNFESRGTCMYMRAVLTAGEEREALLRVRTTMSWKIWLNGAPVGSADLMRTVSPNERWHGITLSKGANVLLVKFVAPREDFNHDISLHHADGRAMTDVASGFEGDPPKAVKNGREARDAKEPPDALDALRAKAQDFAGCTLREAMLCTQLLETVGLEEDAEAVDRRVFDASGGSAYNQFMRGAFVSGYNLLPQARREDIARTHYERAEALDARFAPALMQLARANVEKDSDKSIEFAQRTLSANPSCAEAWDVLAGIYAKRGWAAEQEKALRKAADLGSGDYGRAGALAEYHAARLNHAAALEIAARIQKEQDFEAYWAGIQMLGAAGRDAEQLAALETYRKRYPSNAQVPLLIAGVRERAGKLDEAEAELLRAVELAPTDGAIAKRLLDFHISHGRVEKARELLAKLAKSPGRHQAWDESARKFLEFLAGDDAGWTKPWHVDTAALVAAAPPTDKFPKSAHSVLLLDQRLIRVTGDDFLWREEDIHRVVKILSKEGGESYGQLFLGGGGDWARHRIRELRVFTPDGRVLEMDAVQEEGNIRMPELDKGAILEFRVTRGGGPVGVDQTVFELERSGALRRANEPVVWGRYVVVLPKGAPVRLVTSGMATPATVAEGPETTTWTWEYRDVSEYEPELSMPGPDEILPGVRFIFGRPALQEVVDQLRSRAFQRPAARTVAAKAEELTKGLAKPEERARALFKFAVTEIRPGRNQEPAHTLVDGEGNAHELFLALLRAAGIPYRLAWARGPQPGFREYDPETRTPPYYEEIVLVTLPSGDVWLWPQRWASWGALPNEILGGEAMVADGRGVSLRTIPVPATGGSEMGLRLEIAIDADAMADVTGAVSFTQGRAGQVREQFEQFVSEDQLKMMVSQYANTWMRGITIKEAGLTEYALEDPNLAITFGGTCKTFAQRKAKSSTITFRPVLPARNLAAQVLRHSERKFALRLGFADNVSMASTIVVVLPEYQKVELPENLTLAEEWGSYHLTYRLDVNTLTVDWRMAMKKVDVAPGRYADFAAFMKRIDQAEKSVVSVKVKARDEDEDK
jgi:predicted Zn-dependent protease